jgi:hypothetical protein
MSRILLLLLGFLMVTSCSTTKELPPLAKTVRGEENFGEHIMIYGDYDNQFIWGIVFPRDAMTSISYTEVPEPRNVIKLRSGITLLFVKNEISITKGAKSKMMRLNPYTLYLMNEDLSVSVSKDLSGIKFVPKVEHTWEDKQYVTNQDLMLPPDLYVRFGKVSF